MQKVIYFRPTHNPDDMSDYTLYLNQKDVEEHLDDNDKDEVVVGIYQLVDTVTCRKVSKFEWKTTGPIAAEAERK